mgnify:CR=1 FL=1
MARVELRVRELQVLKMVCSEKKNREMATKLKLNLRTVEKVKTALYRKTKTRSVLGLFKWAYKQGLVKL